ncbi:MAG: TIGR03905 family TSCPD domain-containing protein [Oscillospiraceae bacterium]|jgi:uncharacterized protein (TIGR03905 family)|nr:TIGR03905 family TSCPD domain-containing protein [Oscillospiraceae bacterium]
MTVEFTPENVCSRKMIVSVEDGRISDLQIIGGCDGNLKGITNLVIGMDAREAVSKMRGIQCGRRSTSCPDQLAIAIEQALAEQGAGK